MVNDFGNFYLRVSQGATELNCIREGKKYKPVLIKLYDFH